MRLLFQAHQCPGSSATFSNPGKKNCGRFGRALLFWGFMFGFKLGAVQHALTAAVSAVWVRQLKSLARALPAVHSLACPAFMLNRNFLHRRLSHLQNRRRLWSRRLNGCELDCSAFALRGRQGVHWQCVSGQRCLGKRSDLSCATLRRIASASRCPQKCCFTLRENAKFFDVCSAFMSMLKAIHSQRQADDVVRILFEHLPNLHRHEVNSSACEVGTAKSLN